MQNKFIWNIDQDTIHFVSDFNFESSPEDNYITGEYYDADNSIVLYTKDISIPVNLDYFIRLWKALEPDKEIFRDKIKLIDRVSNKISKVIKKSSGSDTAYIVENVKVNEDLALSLSSFLTLDPTPDDLRRFFTPTIVYHNTNVMDTMIPEKFPHKDSEWQALTEEEVFQYVSEFAERLTQYNPSELNRIIMDMMNQWQKTGVPLDIRDYIIDEANIDWPGLLNYFKENLNFKIGSNKKKTHKNKEKNKWSKV